jgi:glycosidase
MQPLPVYPSLYQINTRAFLHDLHPQATLDDIPESFLDQLAAQGFDLIWFLGVWQTGAAGRAVSRSRNDWREGFLRELPDLQEEDITGSPFAVASYTLHRDFGDPAALPRLRRRLNDRGLRLLLDFVPNHVALDHPWTENYPEYFIHASPEDLARAPQNYHTIAGQRPMVVAYGRDPYWPPWVDALQLNHGNPALRRALLADLEEVAGVCDGLRCDMTMLLLPEVFQRTWGASMEASFWPEAISRVKSRYPDFVFLAEVYWGLESTLQQQGFDFTYDKHLYDHLRAGRVSQVRQHLQADLAFQARCARFLENHDEARAETVFSEKHQTSALLTYLAPGMRFFHEGQLEGRRIQHSIHLRRRPAEAMEQGTSTLASFYQALLSLLRSTTLRSGTWQLHPGEGSCLAFHWQGEENVLVVVNHGPDEATCLVSVPWPSGDRERVLGEVITEEQRGQESIVQLPPWGYLVLCSR